MIKTASLFSQVLQLFPRLEFEHAVQKHQAERYAKGLSCWQQFVGMLFCQLAQAHSLREGVHPKVVSERLGHSTIGITMDTYSHVMPSMQEEAARKLDKALRTASLRNRGESVT